MYIQSISTNAVNPVNHYQREGFVLPEDFKVYVRGNTVINHPYRGFQEKTLPTFNHYEGEDGGYVAIYTHNPEGSVYGVGNDIYVVGQVRLKGHYEGRGFIPNGYVRGDNITQDRSILEICHQYLPQEMKGNVWVGGDTGGWFGIRG